MKVCICCGDKLDSGLLNFDVNGKTFYQCSPECRTRFADEVIEGFWDSEKRFKYLLKAEQNMIEEWEND